MNEPLNSLWGYDKFSKLLEGNILRHRRSKKPSANGGTRDDGRSFRNHQLRQGIRYCRVGQNGGTPPKRSEQHSPARVDRLHVLHQRESAAGYRALREARKLRWNQRRSSILLGQSLFQDERSRKSSRALAEGHFSQPFFQVCREGSAPHRREQVGSLSTGVLTVDLLYFLPSSCRHSFAAFDFLEIDP